MKQSHRAGVERRIPADRAAVKGGRLEEGPGAPPVIRAVELARGYGQVLVQPASPWDAEANWILPRVRIPWKPIHPGVPSLEQRQQKPGVDGVLVGDPLDDRRPAENAA